MNLTERITVKCIPFQIGRPYILDGKYTGVFLCIKSYYLYSICYPNIFKSCWHLMYVFKKIIKSYPFNYPWRKLFMNVLLLVLLWPL